MLTILYTVAKVIQLKVQIEAGKRDILECE
jgi:hypothetical protein